MYLNIDFDKHVVYVLLILGCFYVTTVLQAVIVFGTIRPKCNDLEKNVSNRNLQKNLKIIAVYTLVFSVIDFGLVVLQLVMVKLSKTQLPIVLLINRNLKSVSLSCLMRNKKKQGLIFFINSHTKRCIFLVDL